MVGLALEGGGAKGAYQVGAYMALINNGIKFDWIAGTSIGALNAALMVEGNNDKLLELWLNATSDIVGINSELITKIKKKNFKASDLKEGFNNLKAIIANHGIDTAPFMEAVHQNVNEKKIRKSKIKLGLVTVKVKKMEAIELSIDDIPEGKLAEYIMASCYLPVFSFKKIIDDEYYLDGGFYNNIPLQFLETKGCDTIYAVRLGSIGLKHNKLKKETKVIEIKPKKTLGSMFIFDKESNTLKMRRGYYDTLKIIKNLDGYEYYFNAKSDKYYEHIISKVDNQIIKELKKRHKSYTNKEMLIKVIEHLLIIENIDELNLYSFKKQIRYLKKKRLNFKKPYNEFIKACKSF